MLIHHDINLVAGNDIDDIIVTNLMAQAIFQALNCQNCFRLCIAQGMGPNHSPSIDPDN